MANGDSDTQMMLTIFLKDTQRLTLREMIAALTDNGFFRDFPPAGVEVKSWVQLMSFGHVVTLAAPPDKLRAINGALESGAYGTFACETRVGYDFLPTARAMREKADG